MPGFFFLRFQNGTSAYLARKDPQRSAARPRAKRSVFSGRALKSFELQDPSHDAAQKLPRVTLFQRSRKNALREGLIGIVPISTCKTMMRPNQM
ncbi:MAG: hypothetical protein V4661_01740 [Pseudomonadota bacterium]